MRRKVFVFILILFTVVLVACSDDDEKTNDVIEERSIPVEVTEVIQEDFIVEKSLTGRVEPKDMTPVMLEMSGEISELNVKNGDRVEEDDVIAKMKTQVGEIDIKAPTSGEVTELSAKEDVLVSNEEPLAILLDLDELSITFTVTNKVRELFGKDATINRTSTGGKQYVHNLTVDELKKYDYGSWFDPKYKEEKIPTLEEALQFVADKNIDLNIELKNGPIIPENLEEKVLDLVYKYSLQNRVIFSAFDHRVLEKLYTLDNNIKAAFIFHVNLIDLLQYFDH